MASGVLFGSPKSLIVQPGAYSQVIASGLDIAPAFAFNVVCVIGAALGGEPMVPYYFNDPVQAQAVFGSGTPLAEAIRFAFRGGGLWRRCGSRRDADRFDRKGIGGDRPHE